MPSSFFSQSSRTSSGTAPAPLAPAAPWQVHLKQELEAVLQRPVDLVRLHERMNPAPTPGDPSGSRERRPPLLAVNAGAGMPPKAAQSADSEQIGPGSVAQAIP